MSPSQACTRELWGVFSSGVTVLGGFKHLFYSYLFLLDFLTGWIFIEKVAYVHSKNIQTVQKSIYDE